VRTFAPRAPVSIYKTKQKAKTENATEAGIHADLDYSRFTHRGTIQEAFKAKGGDKE
jgi:hypothetical protein